MEKDNFAVLNKDQLITKLNELEALRKSMLGELQKAKEDAEAASRAKEYFLRNMEHDIRTPLSGILGLTKVILSREKNEKNRKNLHQIQNCAKELLVYCEGILDLSKILSCAQPIVEKRFNLCKLANELLAIETPVAKAKHLTIKSYMNKDVPQFVIGDFFRISRILLNLVSNAIKFTHSGHVKLKFSMIKKTKRDLREGVLKIIIEDTGVGMPEQIQRMLFAVEGDDCSNQENQETFLDKSTGIGLMVVKRLVKEIDADLDVISEIGNGTKVFLLIPMKLPLDVI